MELVLDAGPLIYLGRLDALDAVEIAGHTAFVPPSVFAEAARHELAFRYPEIAAIVRMREEGRLLVVELDARESRLVADLAGRYGGMHTGELDVLALGLARGWTVCFHERQAARLARALDIATLHLVEVLFSGMPDGELLERRIREFARLTNLRMKDLDVLLNLIRERR